ncbi:unnamed protein product [Cutaneotrichosporon oleaginosum]
MLPHLVLLTLNCVLAFAVTGRQVNSSCPQGETLCDGECVDTETSYFHCGKCSQSCSYGDQCRGGTCECEDGPGTVRCGEFCVNLSADFFNCGQCTIRCQSDETCEEGSCRKLPRPSCDAPNTECWYVDMYGDTLDLCADLQTDKDHCGACRAKCAWGNQCIGGKCICDNGQAGCLLEDDYQPIWECPDFSTNWAHCGGCGIVCGNSKKCVDGKCVGCPASHPDSCGDDCLNLQTDLQHCGACSTRCAPDAISCTDGKCQCPPGKTSCGVYSMSCVETSSDTSHCGGCFQPCPAGQQCQGGKCLACAEGRKVCWGNDCSNLMNDNENCGDCFNTREDSLTSQCQVGDNCVNGTCVGNAGCGPGQIRCPGACAVGLSDCCFNPQNDNQHCGGCWNRCEQGKNCVAGVCQ